MKKITVELINQFKEYLISEEKSQATIEKYIRDVTAFMVWLDDREIAKTVVVEYKHTLIERYTTASVNSMLSSINSFFMYMEWYDCKVKAFKIQKQIFAKQEKELTKAEYERLLKAAKDQHNDRLYYLMQTICATGIRISELRFIDVSAVKTGKAEINCKGMLKQSLYGRLRCLREWFWKKLENLILMETSGEARVKNYVQ